MTTHHRPMPTSNAAAPALLPRWAQVLVWASAALARSLDEVDMATATADLDATVRAAMAPRRASLWLRAGDQR